MASTVEPGSSDVLGEHLAKHAKGKGAGWPLDVQAAKGQPPKATQLLDGADPLAAPAPTIAVPSATVPTTSNSLGQALAADPSSDCIKSETVTTDPSSDRIKSETVTTDPSSDRIKSETVTTDPSSDRIKVGDAVKIVGLHLEPIMNGKLLVVESIREDGVLVFTYNDQPIGIRPENVHLPDATASPRVPFPQVDQAGAAEPQGTAKASLLGSAQEPASAPETPSVAQRENEPARATGTTAYPEDQWAGLTCSPAHPNANKWMISVVSAPRHFRARQAIRDSYAKDALSLDIPVTFFVGQLPDSVADKAEVERQLAGESNVVRLTGFDEGYHQLSHKALGIFEHGYKSCYLGVMKVDDDVFADVPGLDRLLTANVDPLSLMSTYAGSNMHNAPVEKNSDGKWFAHDQYPHDTWPDYMDGPGFFLGRNLIKHIMSKPNCLTDIRIDDAAVGVCLQDYAGMVRMPMQHSGYEFKILGNALVIHPLAADEMDELFTVKRLGGDVTGLTPSTCIPPAPTACLCGGSPHFTNEENEKCWQKASGGKYADVVPRTHLVHH